jgi:hypothetical protein
LRLLWLVFRVAFLIESISLRLGQGFFGIRLSPHAVCFPPSNSAPLRAVYIKSVAPPAVAHRRIAAASIVFVSPPPSLHFTIRFKGRSSPKAPRALRFLPVEGVPPRSPNP